MGDVVKQWIVKWFEEQAGIALSEIEAGKTKSYFDQGWIDSFQFIQFIGELEETFDVQFSNDQFENRAFATIDGLAATIQEMKNES